MTEYSRARPDDWYKTVKHDHDVTLISEPFIKEFYRCNMWHIRGRDKDLLIDSDLPRPGTLYRAVADRPVKGQGGMFVKTPDGMGFLRQVRGLSPGQSLLVQVTGYAELGKALHQRIKFQYVESSRRSR